jgi:hypothetical protein
MDLVFACFTLEPAWKNNEAGVSCIPIGRYKLDQRLAVESSKLGYDHMVVSGVPDRTAILVHAGNYRDSTQGCILVGNSTADLNGDGQQDVASSRATLKRLLGVVDGPMFIDIIDVAGR